MSLGDERSVLYGSEASAADRRRAFVGGAAPVAVYGLGKMGLPLAAVFADVTGNTTGVDVDERVVEQTRSGECHVKGEPGLPELVRETVESGALSATSDPIDAAIDASLHVVIVPTEIRDGRVPDLSSLRSAVASVGTGLSPGDLVVIESTVPPGTCREEVEPLLVRESGLSEADFGLAFCPERTSSGRALTDIRGAYPKVVGGIDDESTQVAVSIYDEITSNEVIAVSDVTVAECVKVFEGIYRDVNIALANELARFADELSVDVTEAISVANTQPFCAIHDPGPGVGGHCIPYYPYFLLEPFSTDAPLIRTARRVNDGMPLFTVGKLLESLATAGVRVEEASVAILGLTYRPGVEEIRKTPAMPISRRLDRLGARVYGVDPVLDDVSAFPVERASIADLPSLDLDAIVLVTPHEEFRSMDWAAFSPLVVLDCRDSLDLDGTDHSVYTIGGG